MLRLSLALIAVLALGCSDAPTDEPDDTQFPADVSLEGIEAFLATQDYRDWHGDAAIRPSDNDVNPHGDGLRVFFNALAAEAGNDASPAVGSMIVKEFYDLDGVQVGTAVRLKTADNEWTYYCTNPGDELCAAEGEPVHGVGTQVSCGFCHSDVIFSPVP